jgi:C1A family cysteine protease
MVILRVFDSFYLGRGDRTIDRLGPAERSYGNHAVCIIGYVEDDGEEWFVVQNSWGEGWGERGLALMSERYLTAVLVEVTVVSPSST